MEQLIHFQRKREVNLIRAALPISPHPRQLEFLDLAGEEALFGGAAGGGKSEALLMWLAEGISIPGYTGVLFRRHAADLIEGNESILAKSMRLYPALGGTIVGLEWSFPSGAKITLDGIAHDRSVLKQQGKAFHRVAFDELTHFTEAMYDFIYTTRVRRTIGFPIKCGVRASANPGGPGHDWVKAKFITLESMEWTRNIDKHTTTPIGTIFYGKKQDGSPDPDICYVPSRAIDNPSLDIEDYLRRMAKNKNPVERARMMNGDWSVAPEGLIKQEWLRYYRMRGNSNIVELLDSSLNVIGEFDERECRRFVTIDTAGGSKDITRESKGKNLSWTVAQVWDFKQLGTTKALMIRYCWRDRVGFTTVADTLVSMTELWKPRKLKVENATMGPHLVDLLKFKIPISCVNTEGKGKVERAFDLLAMLSEGQVYLPLIENSWKPTLESEWLSWQGTDDETNDQVDAAAYAAMECTLPNSGVIKMLADPRLATTDLTPKRTTGWF